MTKSKSRTIFSISNIGIYNLFTLFLCFPFFILLFLIVSDFIRYKPTFESYIPQFAIPISFILNAFLRGYPKKISLRVVVIVVILLISPTILWQLGHIIYPPDGIKHDYGEPSEVFAYWYMYLIFFNCAWAFILTLLTSITNRWIFPKR